MFSYETEYIIRKVQNKIVGKHERITLRSILSAPIHDSIKVYFRASIADQQGYTRRFHSEESANIEKIKSEIELLLPSNYTFNKDSFTSLLTDAVHFQFNYLCRPRWTMTEFFFHDSPSLSVSDLKQRFLYFSAYDYYPTILLRYLKRKNILHLDREMFESITFRIDRLVLGDATPEDYAALLRPLADFISYGREDGSDTIPEHALALFFADKGLTHIKEYLEATAHSRNIEQISLSQLQLLLTEMPRKHGVPPIVETPSRDEQEVTDQRADFDEQSERSKAEVIPDEKSTITDDAESHFGEDEPEHGIVPEERVHEAATQESIDQSIVEEPYGERSEIQDEADTIPDVPTEEKPHIDAESESDEEEIIEDEERFEGEEYSEEVSLQEDESLFEDKVPIEADTDDTMDFEHETEPGEGPPEKEVRHEERESKTSKRTSAEMPPLELLIDDDERKRFIRKLFNGDSAYFNVVLQTLNKMTSWKEASLYIDEIFLMNGVDPYSTDSVNFTDKVYARFSHKSKFK